MNREKDGDVYVVRMQNGENKIDLDFLSAFNEQLDAVEKDSEGACAMVLTGEGKFFSTGLNLDFLMNASAEDRAEFGTRILATYRRFILFPVPVVGALNGHAFAAGAFLSLACDFRVQREDRGWFCISEVDVGVPIGASMGGLLKAKLAAPVAREAALTGKRYDGPAAVAAGICDATASEADLVSTAIAIAAPLAAKQRPIFAQVKAEMYREVADGYLPENAS